MAVAEKLHASLPCRLLYFSPKMGLFSKFVFSTEIGVFSVIHSMEMRSLLPLFFFISLYKVSVRLSVVFNQLRKLVT
jgi:hypothetical protein